MLWVRGPAVRKEDRRLVLGGHPFTVVGNSDVNPVVVELRDDPDRRTAVANGVRHQVAEDLAEAEWVGIGRREAVVGNDFEEESLGREAAHHRLLLAGQVVVTCLPRVLSGQVSTAGEVGIAEG